MRKSTTKNLTEGKPMSLILGFMLPLLLGLVFQQLYNMVDTMVVGKFLGNTCLAGVGSTGSINFLVLGFCMGICSGFAIPVAQKFGQQDYEGLKKCVGNILWLSLGISVVITAAVCLLCANILDWMNTPSDAWQYAYDYIFVIFLGIPVTFLYNTLSGLMRSLGDSKTPLYFLLLSSALNVVLDLVFIINFKMGVAGAAWATVLSQLISGLLCLVVIAKKFPLLHVGKSELALDRKYIKTLLSMGLPMGLQYSITAIGSIIMQVAVNGLGTIYVSAVTAGSKVNQIFACAMDAMGTTMATYASQNVGAGKYDRLKVGVKDCGILGIGYSVIALIVIWLCGAPLSSLFVDLKDPSADEILIYAAQFLRTIVCFYVPLAFVNIIRFTIQGMGFSRLAVLAGAFEMVARTIIALLTPIWGYNVACFANPAAWVMADLFLIPAFFYCLKTVKFRLW